MSCKVAAEWLAFRLLIWEVRIYISVRKPAILTKDFCNVFPILSTQMPEECLEIGHDHFHS